MVLLSKLFNSIRGVLTPGTKKRSREEMSGTEVNEVRRKPTLERSGHVPQDTGTVDVGARLARDDPCHTKLKLTRVDNVADTACKSPKAERSYVDLLPSVEVVKGRGSFVWKQFPAPAPSAMKFSDNSTRSDRDDVPDRIIGSALRPLNKGSQDVSLQGPIEQQSRPMRSQGNVNADYSRETIRSRNEVPNCGNSSERKAPSGLGQGGLQASTPKSEAVAHMEFYGRFLNRMHSIMSRNIHIKDSDHLLQSESSKHAYEYHCERIQKLTHRAKALLDYKAAEKRQIELQEIENNINKIRDLRLKPKSDIEYLRVVPLPQITDSDRVQFRNLVNREPNEAVLRHEASKVRLMGSDLARLSPGCWLNDEIINLYMRLLQERDTRLHAEGKEKYPKCHFFNSFFLSKLYKDTGSYDYDSVRRWTVPGRLKAIGQSRKSILDCDKIIVPVNQSNIHWVVAIIDLENKRFEYFDSLYGEDTTCLDHLSRYLMDEFKNKRNEERPDILDWPKAYPKSIPGQVNGYDCGVFLILFADYLSKGAKLNFSQESIEDFRVKLALDFANMTVA